RSISSSGVLSRSDTSWGWLSLCSLALVVGCRGGGDDTGLPELETCSVDAVESGTLRAVGTEVLDEHDRLVTLRGVNAGGRSKFAPYSPFEYEEGGFEEALATYLDRPRAWGFDVLRVPFSWAAAEPEQGSWDEEYLERYDLLLDEAWARGLWTIVDFHQDVYAESLCGDGFPEWTLSEPGEPQHDCESWFSGYLLDDDVRDAFDTFWSDETGVRTAFAEMWATMSARHADRPGVIGFEIINEPYQGSSGLTDWEEGVLGPFYSEMIAVIQGQDPDALVLFDATGAQSSTLTTGQLRPEGDNIIFAPHFYDPGALFGFDLVLDVHESLSAWKTVGNEWDIPVLLGEFGIDAEHNEVETYARETFTALDSLQMHGTWWEYSESSEMWNYENLSVWTPEGEEMTAMLDGIVRPYARVLAGELTEHSFDETTGSLTMSWEATAGGVTELILPERVYPGDVRVTGEGGCVELDGDQLRVQALEDTVVLVVDPR
ncbi:MAG: cellulase family glycosylhydrolase, partial [Myxococcota bacterium]|nr:cellulase family glycosylhydrolase [Myxococcota bacterium]